MNYSTESGRHSGETLTDATVRGGRWATPTSSDNSNRTTKIAPSHGKTHGMVLAGQAANFSSRHFPETQKDGRSGLVLNPRFVETLMGLPVGFTDCGCWEMVLSHSKRKKRSDFSSGAHQQE